MGWGWLRGDRDDDPRNEIRKGGIGHNEVVPATVVMTPDGLQIAPEPEVE
jgi:hypothetical protein